MKSAALEGAVAKRCADDKPHIGKGLDQIQEGSPGGGDKPRSDRLQQDEEQANGGPVPPAGLLYV